MTKPQAWVGTLWVCPDCKFAYAARQKDLNGGKSCPACANMVLVGLLNTIRENLVIYHQFGSIGQDQLAQHIDSLIRKWVCSP